jgi:HD superfamily phosphohydrolase
VSQRALDAHRVNIESFAERQLRPYLAQLRTHEQSHRRRAKEFNDPIWGTLQLRAAEIVVLDSPLLQRLRRIRQLGVVHLVYPGATHTRLEHSMGVVHQVQRLVTALNEGGCVNDRGYKPIDEQLETVLRMAALCHDVGHGAMSHVSEYAFDDDRQCRRLLRDFQDELHQAGRAQLSEMAAYLIVGSPAFRELLRLAFELTDQSYNPDLADEVRAIIIGKAANNKVVLAHELVSGPFDADKLDYLPRDAMMCGVPVVTDITRLIQKVRAARVDKERLTPKLQSFVKDSPTGYIVTGVSRSGGRTLDELALARALMFDKIYRHQKVRAAEVMVFVIMRKLASLLACHAAEVPLLIFDDQLLALSKESLLGLMGIAGNEVSEAQNADIDIALDIANRLRDRRIFARGFAFAGTMTGDGYRNDVDHSAGLKRLILDANNPIERARLTSQMAEELRKIAGLLGEPLPELPADDLEAYLQLSPPKAPPKTASADTGHAHLVDEDGTLTQVQEDAAETLPWSDAYVATRDIGHLFCPVELATLAFLAAQTIVRVNYQVRTPPSMAVYAKQDLNVLDSYRRTLKNAGYYGDLPADLGPEPEILKRVDFGVRVRAVVDNLAGYSGPEHGELERNETHKSVVTQARILSFVKQFPDDDLIDAALRILEGIKLLDRAVLHDAVTAFIAAHPDFAGGSYCPLGDPKDSSSLITYMAGDVAAKFRLEPRLLGDALGVGGPIIFFDDVIGLGSQAIDIIEVLLGVPRTTELGEYRASALPLTFVEELKKRKVAFVFLAGLDVGHRALEARTLELGLDAVVFRYLDEGVLPSVEGALRDHPHGERFMEFCRTIGAEILMDHNGRTRAPDWVQARALGYGNRGLLLTSTFNTPTMTLSCLWASASEKSWVPLLPRRPKS